MKYHALCPILRSLPSPRCLKQNLELGISATSTGLHNMLVITGDIRTFGSAPGVVISNVGIVRYGEVLRVDWA